MGDAAWWCGGEDFVKDVAVLVEPVMPFGDFFSEFFAFVFGFPVFVVEFFEAFFFFAEVFLCLVVFGFVVFLVFVVSDLLLQGVYGVVLVFYSGS